MPRPPLPLHCDHGLRRHTIVEAILADVFHGRVRAGEHLTTQELADRFHVSHTPIREALIALAGIGIIDLVPNRGAIVRQVTTREVREVCQVRRILECEATRSACGRIDPEQLEQLRLDLHRLMSVKPSAQRGFVEEARTVDSRLHDLIAESSGNAFLAKEISRLKILFRAFRDVAWQHDTDRHDFHRLAEESREHLNVVEALQSGDSRSAQRAMAHHIRSGLHYWRRALPQSNHTAKTPSRNDKRSR